MGIIDSAINAATTVSVNKENRKYADRVNRQVWAREDTAVQRRTADMEAAGFNKVLAAGVGAAAGPAVTSMQQAPQVSDPVEDALSIMQQEANVAQTKAQTGLLKKQNRIEQLELDRQERTGGKPKSKIGEYAQDLLTGVDMVKDKLRGKIEDRKQSSKDAEASNLIKKRSNR